MTKAKYDIIAAAFIALIQSLFPVLVLTGAVHWTNDTVAAVMLVVTNAVTLLGVAIQPALQTQSTDVVKVNFNAKGQEKLNEAA